MAAGPPKRLRAWVKLAEAEGWTFDMTSDGHPRLKPPSGVVDPHTGRPAAPVTFSSTPSDIRGDRNAAAYLRRYGVPLPYKGTTKKKEDR